MANPRRASTPDPVARVRQWLDELTDAVTADDLPQRVEAGRRELTHPRETGAVGRCYAMLRVIRGASSSPEANEALWALAVLCVQELMLTIDRDSAHVVRDVEIAGDPVGEVASRRGERPHITAGRLRWARHGIRQRLLEALDRDAHPGRSCAPSSR